MELNYVGRNWNYDDTGTLGTVVVGATTPLDCYVGLGAGAGDGTSIEQPVGVLVVSMTSTATSDFLENISLHHQQVTITQE